MPSSSDDDEDEDDESSDGEIQKEYDPLADIWIL